MYKNLVTGGAGFLGSHLCEKLIERGEHVICLDNFFTGQRSNIAHLLNNRRFELIEQDVTTPLDFDVTHIYNLACPASPIHYQIDPIQTMRTSVLGAFNVLELAKRTNAKVLQASTSEVYGDPKIHPQTESYWGHVNPIGIRSCYDEGKRCAETLFYDYCRIHKLNIKIMRIFNTYGPRMHIEDGRVVSNFIVQALSGKDLTVYGDGSQTRSFCYADDLINGMLLLMDSDPSVTGPINIGNPDEFTVLELANIILHKIGGTSKIVFKPLPSDDPVQRKPNISLANSQINWRPLIKLDEGLNYAIAYFQSLIK